MMATATRVRGEDGCQHRQEQADGCVDQERSITGKLVDTVSPWPMNASDS